MAIQCKLEISSANVNIKDRIISKLKTRRQNPVSEYSTNGNSSFSSVAGSMYLPTTTEEDTSESGVSRQKICNVEKENPQFYLGLPKIMYNIIDLLQKKTQCSSLHILMTLKKIRTGDTFKRIGLEFGFSRGHVSKLFKKTLPKIAFLLKQLIVWPEKKLIQKHLPIQFRYRYKNVQSIIDCYEIEIEKPSDVSLQSLTWSQYKNANTMKYLISSTPDGLINFVSRGYSGRISDTALVQDSGYLQIVPAGSSVLADRGFKEIASLLREKDCILLRPPSVNAGEKLSKNLVRESKRIASCRVHIERLIRRVREFNSARLHACVDIKNVYMLDDIMYVICGLVNLQKKLTKY
ncbi:hypothetical protein NQ314_009190 [Rhamnusium bicolor]|uniref:DDE Tnp4 domain-containing protein n=1 Tax=Rhamnusium bicolor TaxID=1586634 RepID=A0AAV8Y3U3_9CUCU|nr:hypothetical protein NQ314_009190 [Rhamnusium bicolor]